MVDKQDILRMAAEAEQEIRIFAFAKDTGRIVGREGEARELVRALSGYRKGYAHPFVFVYGRTGSGKSAMARLVCESLDLQHRIVNLRQARTAFGCASLILSELGVEAKAWQGTAGLVEAIAGAIERLPPGPFVLVLDEFDVLLGDRRGRPSDLVYRLLMVHERLRDKGRLVTLVAISNDASALDGLDDRVRSRIGASPEVPFGSYPREEILAILKEKAAGMFELAPEAGVLERCAELAADEHGDARRAIGLMRMAGEAAAGQPVARAHVDLVAKKLEGERLVQAMSAASYQLKAVCAAIVRLAYREYEPENAPWHSTSTLYQEYCNGMYEKEERPLTYRRVSELLVELENMGLVVSRRAMMGRYGYGKQHRLAVFAEVAGRCCYPW